MLPQSPTTQQQNKFKIRCIRFPPFIRVLQTRTEFLLKNTFKIEQLIPKKDHSTNSENFVSKVIFVQFFRRKLAK